MSARRRIVGTAALIAALAAPGLSRAAGINLFWNDCGLGATAASTRTFACNTNDGFHVLTVSFMSPLSIPDVNGLAAIIDLSADECPMKSWWEFKNLGSCRQTALSVTSALLQGQGACADPWQGQGLAVFSAYVMPYNSNLRRSRILASVALPTTFATAIDADTEYYGLNLVIRNQRTVGPGACAGCGEPVCLSLQEVMLTSSNSGDMRISNPLQDNFAGWQGKTRCPCVDCPPDAPCVTPTINRTWAQLKTVYR